MFIVAVLSVLACAFAADPDPSDKSTFHDTGSLLWKDCGGHDAWLKVTNFDMTPSPLRLPGHSSLTLHAHNGNTAIDRNVVLDITIKKRVVGRWATVPCRNDLGTCRYADVCHFMTKLFPDGNCPQEFTDHGLPCTCPFTIPAHKRLTLTNDPLHLGSTTHSDLTTGEFYLKMQMWEKGGTAERMCLEFYFNMHTDRA